MENLGRGLNIRMGSRTGYMDLMVHQPLILTTAMIMAKDLRMPIIGIKEPVGRVCRLRFYQRNEMLNMSL